MIIREARKVWLSILQSVVLLKVIVPYFDIGSYAKILTTTFYRMTLWKMEFYNCFKDCYKNTRCHLIPLFQLIFITLKPTLLFCCGAITLCRMTSYIMTLSRFDKLPNRLWWSSEKPGRCDCLFCKVLFCC